MAVGQTREILWKIPIEYCVKLRILILAALAESPTPTRTLNLVDSNGSTDFVLLDLDAIRLKTVRIKVAIDEQEITPHLWAGRKHTRFSCNDVRH